MNWIIYINVLKLQLSDCAILHFSGVGVAMTRDPATLMVGQYFKRKRELIEIILVSGSGLGIAAMSVFIKVVVRSVGAIKSFRFTSRPN